MYERVLPQCTPMMNFSSPRIRALLLVLATVAIAVATTGCDWANVGGPW